MSNDDASKVYGSQVAEIIAATPRDSTWEPERPVELFVKERHVPTTSADLSAIEKRQLEGMWPGEDLDRLLREGVDDFPIDLEIAIVVDDSGVPRYRMFGCNFGCVYLMEMDTLECIAFASQHHLEHWHADQRAIFWAMDRALRRNDHGFQQALSFCWWDDACWQRIAGKPRGTVASEPYIRKQFAGST